MLSLPDIIGRFHPLLLHLPIGVFIYAFLHLGFDLFVKKKNKPVDITFALAIGALSAVLSSVSGYMLSLNGEYEGSLLDWHQWLGFGTALASIVLFLVYRRMKSQHQFFGLFTAFVILLIATGHYGGSLTHGEDFLSMDNEMEDEVVYDGDVSEAIVFDSSGRVLARYC